MIFFVLNEQKIYFVSDENFSLFKSYFDIMMITLSFNKNNLFLWCVDDNNDAVFNHLCNYEIKFFLKEANNLLNSFSCDYCLKYTANLDKFFKFNLINNKNYFVGIDDFNEVFFFNNLETFLFKLWITSV